MASGHVYIPPTGKVSNKARECYIAMHEMDDHLQVLNNKVTVEPTEDLEEVSLDDDTPGRTTHINTQANPLVCKSLPSF